MIKVKHVCNREAYEESERELDYITHKFTIRVWACPKCDNYEVDSSEYEQVIRKIRDELGSTNTQD